MRFNTSEDIINILRERIYDAVPSKEIEAFVHAMPDFANNLANVVNDAAMKCMNLSEGQLHFLEMIDGDSDYIIKWEKDFFSGVGCTITCKFVFSFKSWTETYKYDW